MSDSATISSDVSTPSRSRPADLSEAIAAAVGRQAGEEVRCMRVYGNCYRCNWWQRDEFAGGQIVRSRFLHVSQTPDGLIIKDLTR